MMCHRIGRYPILTMNASGCGVTVKEYGHSLARLCGDVGLTEIALRRIATTLVYDNGDEACDAAFVGGPVALAWSRFDAETRTRVRARYLAAVSSGRQPDGRYLIPAEFVVAVAARADMAM